MPDPCFFSSVVRDVLAGRIGSEKQHGRFREGPREMGVADLRARGPVPLPRRRLRARDEAARREEILDPREAGDIMDCIEQHHAQHLADSGDRTQQVQRLGMMLLGRV